MEQHADFFMEQRHKRARLQRPQHIEDENEEEESDGSDDDSNHKAWNDDFAFGDPVDEDDDFAFGDPVDEVYDEHGVAKRAGLYEQTHVAVGAKLRVVPASVNTPAQNKQLRDWAMQLLDEDDATVHIPDAIRAFEGSLDAAVQLLDGRLVTVLCVALALQARDVLTSLAARNADPNACASLEPTEASILGAGLGAHIHPVPAAFALFRSFSDEGYVDWALRLFPTMDLNVELVHVVKYNVRKLFLGCDWWERKPASAALVRERCQQQQLLCWLMAMPHTRPLAAVFIAHGADPMRECAVAPFHTPLDYALLHDCLPALRSDAAAAAAAVSDRSVFLDVFNRTTLPTNAAVRLTCTIDGRVVSSVKTKGGVLGGLLPTNDIVRPPEASIDSIAAWRRIGTPQEREAMLAESQDVIEAMRGHGLPHHLTTPQLVKWNAWTGFNMRKPIAFRASVDFLRIVLAAFGVPQRQAHASRVHDFANAARAATVRNRQLRLQEQARLTAKFNGAFSTLVAAGRCEAADKLLQSYLAEQRDVGNKCMQATRHECPGVEHVTEYGMMIASFLD